MSRSGVAAGIALALLLGAGCTRPAPSGAGGTSAGGAGSGGAPDGGKTDAGVDAGCIPVRDLPTPVVMPNLQPVPGWHRWPHTPDDCTVLVPDDLSVVAPVPWETCPFMPDGCTRATAPWAKEVTWGYGGLLSVVVVEGKTYLAVVRAVNDIEWGSESLLFRDQQLIGAWRNYNTDGHCSINGPQLEYDGTASSVLMRNQAEYWPYVYYGKSETLMAAPEHTDLFGPPCSFADANGTVERSDRLLVVWGFGGRFTVRDILTGVISRPAPGTDKFIDLYDPVTVRDTVFYWVYTGNDDSIWAWNAAGVNKPVLKDPTYSYDAFASDGKQAAWLRSSGHLDASKFQTVELWTSPVTGSPAKLSPKKVATLPTHLVSPLSVGDGWIAVSFSPTDVRVYHIADGQERRVPVGPGLAYSNQGQHDGLVIAGGALWLRAFIATGAGNDVRFITRFDIAKLPVTPSSPNPGSPDAGSPDAGP